MAASRFSAISSQWRSRLLQPAWLAGVVSVGFHGLLFAASPTFSALNLNNLTEPDPLQESRRVSLVELTPEEQQRLPDFSNSFYSFTPYEDGFGDFGGSGMDGSGLDGLEFDGSETLGTGEATPDWFNFGSGGTPSGGRSQGLGMTPSIVQVPQSPRPPRGGGTASPGPGTPPAGSTPGTGSAAAGTPSTPAGGSTPSTTIPGAGAGTPAQPGAEALAPRPTNPSAGTGGSGDRGGEDSATAMARNLEHDGGTSSEAAEAARRSWLAASQDLSQRAGIPLKTEIQEETFTVVSLVNGEQPCLSPRPQEGLVAALVAPGGDLVREPEVLTSTGYPFLNYRALDYLKHRHRFPRAQQFTAYHFRVEVAYEPSVCVDLKGEPESEPEAEDKEAPAE